MPDPIKYLHYPLSSYGIFLEALRNETARDYEDLHPGEKAPWGMKQPEPTTTELKDMIQDLTLRVSALDSLLRQTFEGHVLFKGRWIPLENFITIINKEQL